MENQELLLSVALKLFSLKGYDATGVQEIVTEAKVTKPTLYHYYGSKRGLLDALLERHFANLTRAIAVAAEYNGDLPFTLRAVVKAVFDFAQANSLFYRMQLAMILSSPESESYAASLKYQVEIIAILERLFRLAAKDHGNMRNRQKRYAFTFLGIINTYITLFLNNNVELNAEAVELAAHQFSHGIYS